MSHFLERSRCAFLPKWTIIQLLGFEVFLYSEQVPSKYIIFFSFASIAVSLAFSTFSRLAASVDWSIRPQLTTCPESDWKCPVPPSQVEGTQPCSALVHTCPPFPLKSGLEAPHIQRCSQCFPWSSQWHIFHGNSLPICKSLSCQSQSASRIPHCSTATTEPILAFLNVSESCPPDPASLRSRVISHKCLFGVCVMDNAINLTDLD